MLKKLTCWRKRLIIPVCCVKEHRDSLTNKHRLETTETVIFTKIKFLAMKFYQYYNNGSHLVCVSLIEFCYNNNNNNSPHYQISVGEQKSDGHPMKPHLELWLAYTKVLFDLTLWHEKCRMWSFSPLAWIVDERVNSNSIKNARSF